MRLFNMMNGLPTLLEVVTTKQGLKGKSSVSKLSDKHKPNIKVDMNRLISICNRMKTFMITFVSIHI